MALFGMPRQHHQVWWDATAWVSKPRHRSPPIRSGETSPGPDHGYEILRPGNCVEGTSHQSARQRGRSRSVKTDLHPVAATTRLRLHLLSRKPTFRKVQNPPGQIEPLDLADRPAPKSHLNKESEKALDSI